MSKPTSPVFALIAAFVMFASCNGGNMSEKNSVDSAIKQVPASTWETLAQKKVYFGHQSVGFNIVEGMQDLMKQYPAIQLNIKETANTADFTTGIFAHSRVGKNTEPRTKIDEFVKFMDNGIGAKADAAALKFCYVDVNADTDVEALFADYVNAMKQLKQKYPKLALIHFTVPLTTTRTSWKTWVKRIIGRKDMDRCNNIKRNQYNDMLVKHYQGKEPILDIAAIESTFPDGSRSAFTQDDKTYYSMVPEYTHDGGHLNDLGRKKAAGQFLVLLANGSVWF